MFWGKKTEAEKKRGTTPKGIPEAVGRYLVVALNQNPDWVWNLKAVLREKEEKDWFEFRVFDQSQAASKKVNVRDFESLGETPDLVLYQGVFNKKNFEVKMETKPKPA
jgi:hypothetical protein